MNYTDALNLYYDETAKCPDGKNNPHRVFTDDNTLKMVCKDWSIVINKSTFVNVYEQLNKLYDEEKYDTYDKFVNKILESDKDVNNIKKKVKDVQNKMNTLFDDRKKYYKLFTADKGLSDQDKLKLIEIYKKKGISSKKMSTNNINYLKWLDSSVKYVKFQNELSELNNEVKRVGIEVERDLRNYITKSGSVKESLNKTIAKKIKKIRLKSK